MQGDVTPSIVAYVFMLCILMLIAHPPWKTIYWAMRDYISGVRLKGKQIGLFWDAGVYFERAVRWRNKVGANIKSRQ